MSELEKKPAETFRDGSVTEPPAGKPGANPKKWRTGGLYSGVKISVKVLDVVILLGVLALVAVFVWMNANSGFTVSFDALGGTDVGSVRLTFGDVLDEPEPPTREGYAFAGWYLDKGFERPWDFAKGVSDSMTLYAKWEPNGS